MAILTKWTQIMHGETWAKIEKGFRRWPKSRASAVDSAEFEQAMQAYGPVDPDYREFVLRYGGGIVGPNPIYGLRRADWMGTIGGKSTAPDVTQWFREKKWLGIDDWLIFSVDQGGNPVGFAKNGTVWLSDQLDFKQVIQLASDFEDYLLKWCLKVRKVQ
jgi:hypothetical protein